MRDLITENLRTNKKSWDAAAERFFGRTALPDYGPYAPTEEKLNLFGDVSGLKVLDVGCGSGHSMKYMASRGVEEVWGLDLSRNQVETANRVLGWNKSPFIFESPMEEDPGIPQGYFDVVYSIYALGWTLDLTKTISNINKYLKPGGIFIFSWEHPIHSRVVYDQGQLQFKHSYHEEEPQLHEAWKPTPAVFHFRRLSSYINELINSGFQIERIVEDIEPIKDDVSNPNDAWYSQIKTEMYPATFILKCKKLVG